jgi:RNA polymerase sigma-70 factor (ECF subfamily)
MFDPNTPTASPGAIAAFARRDPDAVRRFYREYGGLVFTVAMGVTERRELAEEATRRTFACAAQAASRADVDRDPATWIADIATRVAHDVARTDDPASQPDEDATIVAENRRAFELLWRIRQAIDALPRDEAAVARLQHVDALTVAEIATRLGISVEAARSRSSRAHRALAHVLLPVVRRRRPSHAGRAPCGAPC